MWLRVPVPPEKRNAFFRGFNAIYNRAERGYAWLMNAMVARSGIMAIIAFIIIGLSFYGFSRVPTGFLPTEDQGYLITIVQLPDGASLERTQKALDKVKDITSKTPGVDHVITIAGMSALDNSATLANAGVAYVILKSWSERGKQKGEDMLSLFLGLNKSLSEIEEARIIVMPPPAIQGIGNAAGFTLQVELRDGSFDLPKLQSVVDTIVANARTQTSLQTVMASFRSGVPQYTIEIDREKTKTVQLDINQVFSALAGYFGSSYVDQFNKFGRTFQVYVQGDAQFRLRLEDIQNLTVRNKSGSMIPLGTLINIVPSVGPSLISLYNLYPSATIIGVPATGFSSGDSMALMEQIAKSSMPPGMGYEWSALSYQEKLVGNQMYFVFAFGLLLVYLVLAGQYESWFAPISVVLAVPLSLIGPVIMISAFISKGLSNNLYVQIGLVLLIALSAKNAILIVEFARELRQEGKSIAESAVEAARARFRPILMTSFAFILGVAPLVFASGAGAAARKSIGITVFSGMIASTCLAVLFVPAFFVLVQGFEERRKARKSTPPESVPAE
jgi:hydrophobic/amphiphilic exporter-1 (mainly G- bacteria), HAE1 family